MNNDLLLGVNIDHVATVRQARGTPYPDPVHAALEAMLGGADAITLHLREDRRHIQERDVWLICQLGQLRVNLEMAVTPAMLDLACELRPHDICLVPERREELTTEGGLDVVGQRETIAAAVQRLSEAGSIVSLFIDPDRQQLEAAVQCGAPVVELHTGAYADASDPRTRASELQRLAEAARLGQQMGLQVNAGHGLHYDNVAAIAALPEVHELNIGHAIVARALFVGLRQAVIDMRQRMQQARNRCC